MDILPPNPEALYPKEASPEQLKDLKIAIRNTAVSAPVNDPKVVDLATVRRIKESGKDWVRRFPTKDGALGQAIYSPGNPLSIDPLTLIELTLDEPGKNPETGEAYLDRTVLTTFLGFSVEYQYSKNGQQLRLTEAECLRIQTILSNVGPED